MKKFIAKTSHANGKNYNKTTYKVMVFDYCMWFWNIHMVQPPSPSPWEHSPLYVSIGIFLKN